MPRKDHKRVIEVAKSNEEFVLRVRRLNWTCPSSDALLRVEMLLHFVPQRPDRQVFSIAKTNLEMSQ